ncbi:hypothetical protein GC163_00660 [bacterium]|nr:hypothetical protein [bacterium]
MSAELSFRTPVTVSALLTEGEFLQNLQFESSAPRELVAAAQAGDVTKFGRLWRLHLRQRRQGSLPKSLLSLWSRSDVQDQLLLRAIETFQPATSPRRRGQKPAMKRLPPFAIRAQGLIKALIESERSPEPSALQTLLALELLWVMGDRIPQRFWWPLWRQTLTAELALSRAIAPYHEARHDTHAAVGEWQLLGSLVFAEIKGATAIRRQATKLLGQSLTTPTDSDGTPHAELLPHFTDWLAPLLRSSLWSQQAGHSLFDPDEQQLLSEAAEKAVALCRPDGRLALMNGSPTNALPILTFAADILNWSNANPSRTALRSLALHAAGQKETRPSAISVMPSNQSDWARLAVLKSGWTAGSATVTVAHHQPLPQLDVTIAGIPLIHGAWELDVRMGDTGLELADEWSCVCWESEPDADYAELQMEGPGKLRVERLVLLSRKDQFLLLADSVSGAPHGPLALQSRFPLAPGAAVSWETRLRAGRLEHGAAKTRFLPLELPCDPVHSTPNRCELREEALVLEQQCYGQGLLAPLIIDFHPDRRKALIDWKKLTVSESGRVCPPDLAAGYRWRIGADQFLLYRSLKPAKMPRAVLGHHTANGLVVGRFDKQGDVEPVVMVEE